MLKLFGTAALTLAVAGSLLTSTPAHASTADDAAAQRGTTSLAEVLGADGQAFDGKWSDFDIVEAAVYAVLDANPDSPVGLLADGKTRLTAFVPTDKAFRKLVADVFGKKLDSEMKVFAKLAKKVDIATIEDVLLYHVVPGMTITAEQALGSDGAALPTALDDASVTVSVSDDNLKLVDLDTSDGNAKVVVVDINKGNKQIAHAINKVLRPLDLP